MLTLIGLLVMSIVLTSGGNPSGDVIWFRYWAPPSGPFASYKTTGSTGAFLGVWACFVNALFACTTNFARRLLITRRHGH